MNEKVREQLNEMSKPIRPVKDEDIDIVTEKLYHGCKSQLSIRNSFGVSQNKKDIMEIIESKVNEEINKPESNIFIQDDGEVFVNKNIIDDMLNRIKNYLNN